MHSEQIGKLTEALSKAQGEIKAAVKDSSNPFFKSSYADLASVWDACRKPLSSNGLAVVQTTELTEKGIILVTMLAHSSGEWMSGTLPVRPVKDDPQGMGSAITYMRRYALAAIAGVAPEEHDDDGNAASGKDKAKVNKPGTAHPAYIPPPEDSHGGPAGEDLDSGDRDRPIPAVVLLDESRRNTLYDLLEQVTPPQKDIDVWLNRAGIKDFADMPADKGELLIKYLSAKAKAKAAKANG